MIKFIIGFMLGGMFGTLTLAVLVAGREADRMIPDVSADMFQRRDGFLSDCAHVCGNCVHWRDELYAWGLVQYCTLDDKATEAGDICHRIRE